MTIRTATRVAASFNRTLTLPFRTSNTSNWLQFYAGVANQTGTAAWFCFRVMSFNDQQSFGMATAYTIFGTVGEVGSGADLELLTTSVTNGQTVRLGAINIPIPTKCAW